MTSTSQSPRSQIALPIFLTARRVAAEGFDRLAVGQGADELFGGYAKVAHPVEHRREAGKRAEQPEVDLTICQDERRVRIPWPIRLFSVVLTVHFRRPVGPFVPMGWVCFGVSANRQCHLKEPPIGQHTPGFPKEMFSVEMFEDVVRDQAVDTVLGKLPVVFEIELMIRVDEQVDCFGGSRVGIGPGTEIEHPTHGSPPSDSVGD